MPSLARQRLTKPRSSTACFMPTKLGAFSAISQKRFQRDVHRRAAGDVIDHPRQSGTLGELQVVGGEPALRRADEIGGDDQQRIRARLLGMERERFGVGEGLRPGGGHDRHPPGGGLDRHLDRPVALVHGERRGLRRGAVHQDAVRALRDLEFDHRGIGRVVDRAASEGGDQGRNRAAQEILRQIHHGRETPTRRARPSPAPCWSRSRHWRPAPTTGA